MYDLEQLAGITVLRGKLSHLDTYVEIFKACNHPAYISQSEITCGRSTSDRVYRENVLEIVEREFRYCLLNLSKYVFFDIFAYGEIIGFATVEFNTELKYAIWHDIMIKPEYRRRGIAQGVVKEVEQQLKMEGFEVLLLEIGINNTDVHTFVEKLGFEKISIAYTKKL